MSINKTKKYNIAALLMAVCMLAKVHDSYALEVSEPIRINGPMPFGGDVDKFVLIPQTNLVAYLADEEQDQALGVYLSDIKGELSFRLNDQLFSSDIDRDSIEVTSNGLTASAALNDPGTMQTINFSGPVIGTPLAGIVGTIDLALIDDVPQFSDDGKYAVYLYDDNDDGRLNLFSLRLKAGRQPVRLSDDPVLSGDIVEFSISSDSQHVVFRGDFATNSKSELFRVAIDGGNVTRISPEFLSETDVTSFAISGDAQTVAFIADGETFGIRELYSASITAVDSATKLSSITVTNGDVKRFEISADNQWVVYLADQDINSRDELFRVPLEGGEAPQKLHPDFSSAHGETVRNFKITNDSITVVFNGDLLSDSKDELFAVAIDSAIPVRLNQDLPARSRVIDFKISPNNYAVVYRANIGSGGLFELSSVNIAEPGNSILLSPPVGGSSGLFVGSDFTMDPSGEFVVFNVEKPGEQDLYVNSLSGGELETLTKGAQTGGGRNSYSLSENGKYILFLDDPNAPDQVELFSVKVRPSSQDDSLCFPIVTAQGRVVVACL